MLLNRRINVGDPTLSTDRSRSTRLSLAETRNE
jgi:hypothetical protein